MEFDIDYRETYFTVQQQKIFIQNRIDAVIKNILNQLLHEDAVQYIYDLKRIQNEQVIHKIQNSVKPYAVLLFDFGYGYVAFLEKYFEWFEFFFYRSEYKFGWERHLMLTAASQDLHVSAAVEKHFTSKYGAQWRASEFSDKNTIFIYPEGSYPFSNCRMGKKKPNCIFINSACPRIISDFINPSKINKIVIYNPIAIPLSQLHFILGDVKTWVNNINTIVLESDFMDSSTPYYHFTPFYEKSVACLNTLNGHNQLLQFNKFISFEQCQRTIRPFGTFEFGKIEQSEAFTVEDILRVYGYPRNLSVPVVIGWNIRKDGNSRYFNPGSYATKLSRQLHSEQKKLYKIGDCVVLSESCPRIGLSKYDELVYFGSSRRPGHCFVLHRLDYYQSKNANAQHVVSKNGIEIPVRFLIPNSFITIDQINPCPVRRYSLMYYIQPWNNRKLALHDVDDDLKILGIISERVICINMKSLN